MTTTTSSAANSISNPGASTAAPVAAPKWLVPLAAMCFVLGTFIALALKTQNVVREDNLPSSRYQGLAEAYMGMSKEMLAYQATIKGLRKTNDLLTDDVTSRAPQMRILADQAKQATFLAGLTGAEGSGIVVVLNDSTRRPPDTLPSALSSQLTASFIIHDVDLQRVLNELRAGGAEEFAINNQRIVATTAIRCVGPAIQVNGVPITPPYKIYAIGPPDTMSTCLNLPGGIADQLRSTDPAMITITKSPALVIPAFDGATQFRYAKPVPDEAASGSAGA